ncbi:MAG: 30S ribosomal protein S17e [Promethearchaeota archaeon]
MGKVRPDFIKRASRELLRRYPDMFTRDFEKNKELLKEYAIIPSKHVRNRIAGYIVNLVKIREREKKKKLDL